MKRFALPAVVLLGLSACQDAAAPEQSTPEFAPQLATAASPSTPGQAIPGRYIVVFKSDVSDAPGLARRMAAANGGRLHFTYNRAIKGFAAELPAGAAAALARHPNVEFVEQDQVMTAFADPVTWGLDRIDQRSLPLSGTFSFTNTGAGVTAYIIDTGIRFDHSEFGGRAISGFDAVEAGTAADDCNGHGTHVAGTVGGNTYGVAKGVSLVAVRVLDCNGSGSTSGVIAGIDWVTQNHASGELAVANMSLGGGASTALDNAVKRSIADNVSYGVAAGNGNWIGIAQDACRTSPARVPEAMTIGASDKTDRKASWSNYGKCVDWFAPGVGITSSWYTSATATSAISGTSMATPHVVGVAALYLQSNPAAAPSDVRNALYDATTKNKITSAKTVNNHLLFTSY